MKLSNKKEGFTLMELLVYVGIFAIAAGLLTGVLFTVLRVQQRESSSVEVTQQMNFVMQTIQRLVKESSAIIANSTSTDVNNDGQIGYPQIRLVLRMKDSGANPTTDRDPIIIWKDDATNIIKISQGTSPNQRISDLTNSRVIADKLEFTKLVQYPGHDTVSIDMQLTYNSNNPQERISRSLRSAIARVSAATFDSNLLPGSDMTYDLGFSPNTRWRNAAFSRDLLVGGNVGIGTAAPTGQLHIAGGYSGNPGNLQLNIQRLDGIETFGGLRWLNSAGTKIWGLETNTYAGQGIEFNEGATNRMYIALGGNVGIGTASPAQKLHVKGSGAQYIVLEGTGDTDILSRYTNGTYDMYSGLLGASAGPGKWGVYNNGAPRMVIDTAGNVGIGTTTPAMKLSVDGGDNSFAWGGDHSGSGYIRIGNMQICWGNGSATNPTQPYYINYSNFTFPSGCVFNNTTYSIIANPIAVSDNGKAFTQFSTNRGVGGAYISFHKISDASQEDSTATGNMPFTWQAIGTWQ